MKNSYITTDKPYTYEICTNDLKNILKIFPDITAETIGFSVLGKTIFSIKSGSGKNKIIITGAHHGCEWITSMLTMSLLYYLSSDTSQKVESFKKSNTVYFIPMVNPDGVNLSINGITPDLPVFIKNRLLKICDEEKIKNNWQANIKGVDLNHNYDASFERGKALQHLQGIFAPAPTKYSGEYPESEPETQAIVNFTKKISPQLVIAFHSQGEEIFYKYQGKCAKDAEAIAKKLSSASGYNIITADGLTDCSGYKDWVIEKFSIPAFTVEVGKGKNPLPLSQFDKIFKDNLNLLLSL